MMICNKRDRKKGLQNKTSTRSIRYRHHTSLDTPPAATANYPSYRMDIAMNQWTNPDLSREYTSQTQTFSVACTAHILKNLN